MFRSSLLAAPRRVAWVCFVPLSALDRRLLFFSRTPRRVERQRGSVAPCRRLPPVAAGVGGSVYAFLEFGRAESFLGTVCDLAILLAMLTLYYYCLVNQRTIIPYKNAKKLQGRERERDGGRAVSQRAGSSEIVESFEMRPTRNVLQVGACPNRHRSPRYLIFCYNLHRSRRHAPGVAPRREETCGLGAAYNRATKQQYLGKLSRSVFCS